MCDPGEPSAVPPAGWAGSGAGLSSSGAALAAIRTGLAYLNAADAGSMSTGEQAQCLLELERAEAGHTVARARVLAAFTAQGGFEDDGQRCARSWLKWQTRVTGGAAAGAVGWMRRLAAHPAAGRALAAGTVSASWAREICAWSDLLPESHRADAEEILLAAADGGATLADLAALAQEMRRRCAAPDEDPDDGFDDRSLDLGVTFRGAGRVDGDLTPGCTAALSAVLEALGKKAGPEDVRTATQRRHDALEEACRRLLASGMLPGRAGQPTQALVHMTLSQLRGMPGASAAEAAWVAASTVQGGWLAGQDAAAAACDATIVPIVTGHLDPAALDRMVQVFLDSCGLAHAGPAPGDAAPGHAAPGDAAPGDAAGQCGCSCGGCTCPPRQALTGQALNSETLAKLRQSLIALAADVLSGPGGLASWLRTSLADGPAGSPSCPLTVTLPMDIGQAQPAIPAHLRRAVTIRHPAGCEFPGCDQPPAACQVHHIVPRSQGGPTALRSLVGVCAFHHLIVIHRWGWALRLNPDGTTTATSPDGRILHSHSPPSQAA